MEKRFNLRVSVLLNDKCSNCIDEVNYNQLTLINKQSLKHKIFQLDKIYSINEKNQKLFQSILKTPSNLLLDGHSSMVICLGNHNSGKMCTLAGKNINNYEKDAEPGIIWQLMRHLFSKFNNQVSLYSTYSIWCKYLFIERDKVYNLSKQLNQQEWKNNINNNIFIKSYSHFQSIISDVYSKSNNKFHTVVQIILKTDSQSQYPIASSVTFVELGSFIHSPSTKKPQQSSIQNDIECVLNILKQLTKSKQASITNPDIFQSSLLAKVLKQNILKTSYCQFIGQLDDKLQNNIKLLNYLEIIIPKKYTDNTNTCYRQQIKKKQKLLKQLQQKHKYTINILSKCLDIELDTLTKQNKKNIFNGSILNTFNQIYQKIKYGNKKKQSNQSMINSIVVNIQKVSSSISIMSNQYQVKFQQIQEEKQQISHKKKQLNAIFDQITTPQIQPNKADNSLYCKLQDTYNRHFKNEGDDSSNSMVDSQRQSKHEMLPTIHQITTRKNLKIKSDLHTKQRFIGKYQRINEQQMKVLSKRRITQMQTQIGKIFQLILKQQHQIDEYKQKIPAHCVELLNKIKNHQRFINFDVKQAQKYATNTDNSPTSNYMTMLENLKIQDKIDRDLISNNRNNTISMKSFHYSK